MGGPAPGSRGEKIQKVLAAAGICSRREAEGLILQGLVRVNGEVLDNAAARVDPEVDLIECRGRKLEPVSKDAPAGLILYKTAGCVTSSADPHNQRTVYDLLPERERGKRWLYVGRLDKNTEGLMLFTDSGELVHRLSHPSYKVAKHYRVEVAGTLETQALKKLTTGFELDGRYMKIDRARILKIMADTTVLELVLHQGEKRQIKRMLGHIGFRVVSLCRTRLGPLTLAGLERGTCRKLTRDEMNKLIRAV
ncbi:MAG: pseudouridine synthase [Gemmatimonadota bacterium]|nr:pseudouridine synthase [Gemmatimonadota bacterium]